MSYSEGVSARFVERRDPLSSALATAVSELSLAVKRPSGDARLVDLPGGGRAGASHQDLRRAVGSDP